MWAARRRLSADRPPIVVVMNPKCPVPTYCTFNVSEPDVLCGFTPAQVLLGPAEQRHHIWSTAHLSSLSEDGNGRSFFKSRLYFLIKCFLSESCRCFPPFSFIFSPSHRRPSHSSPHFPSNSFAFVCFLIFFFFFFLSFRPALNPRPVMVVPSGPGSVLYSLQFIASSWKLTRWKSHFSPLCMLFSSSFLLLSPPSPPSLLLSHLQLSSFGFLFSLHFAPPSFFFFPGSANGTIMEP